MTTFEVKTLFLWGWHMKYAGDGRTDDQIAAAGEEAFLTWLKQYGGETWQAGYDEGNDDGYYKALQQTREGY